MNCSAAGKQREGDRQGYALNAISGLRPASSARNLHALLDDAAAAVPGAPAVRDQRHGWTYSRLAKLSHAFAGWLAERGVSAGDRVLIQSPNGLELAAMLYGCSRRGAIFVPVNPGMKPFHLRSVFANCEPRIALAGHGMAGAIRKLSPTEVHELHTVWPDIETFPADYTGPDRVTGGDIAMLSYTSGSTAAPKAVVCPQSQMVFAATAINSVLGYRPDDVIFCRLPFSFDYGLYQLLLGCLARAEIVVAGTGPDVALLRQIRQSGATVVPVVPSLAAMLVTLAERDPGPSSVRLFTNTGAALPQATIDALRSRFPGARVARMFGTSECKRISIMPPEAELERPESVGLPLPGTEVVILDDAGRLLPTGQTGEIVVSGPHVMAGYWRAPEITARTFRLDERTGRVWLHTGDYGRLDEDGYLYFEGRRDDMFKYKGTRVSTLEIEAAAMDIPGVRGAAVAPPPAGGTLEIWVATELSPQVVLREIAVRLESAKVPAVCHIVDEIPLTLNGKTERRMLPVSLRTGAACSAAEMASLEPRRPVAGDDDRGDDQAVTDEPATAEYGEHRAVDDRTVHQQPGIERPANRVDVDGCVLEVQPATGQREPRLIDRLLGAEQHAVPEHVRSGGRQRGQPGLLAAGGNGPDNPVRQFVVRFGVKADRDHVTVAGDRGSPVPGAVRDTPDHAGRPLRGAAQSRHDGRRRHAELGQRGSCAGPGGRELPASFVDGIDYDGLFAGEQHDVRQVAECLFGGHLGRQDVGDHDGSPPAAGRICRGTPGRPLRRCHSRG
jgi:acyl-CoA synthetase (AMP-forming)/AMP-acid ligase II